jgi:hypothetical protein
VDEPVRKALSQLDEVDWRSLRTAHRTAENVPGALEALAVADDPQTVDDAYWRLDNHIVLQGTIYPSALAAVPYILDLLLTAPTGPRRIAAYDLLIEIARGVPDPADPSAARLPEQVRPLIKSGRTAYERDLRDTADGDLRRRALDLLATIADDPEALRALLDEVDPGADEGLFRLLEQARAEA